MLLALRHGEREHRTPLRHYLMDARTMVSVCRAQWLRARDTTYADPPPTRLLDSQGWRSGVCLGGYCEEDLSLCISGPVRVVIFARFSKSVQIQLNDVSLLNHNGSIAGDLRIQGTASEAIYASGRVAGDTSLHVSSPVVAVSDRALQGDLHIAGDIEELRLPPNTSRNVAVDNEPKEPPEAVHDYSNAIGLALDSKDQRLRRPFPTPPPLGPALRQRSEAEEPELDEPLGRSDEVLPNVDGLGALVEQSSSFDARREIGDADARRQVARALLDIRYGAPEWETPLRRYLMDPTTMASVCRAQLLRTRGIVLDGPVTLLGRCNEDLRLTFSKPAHVDIAASIAGSLEVEAKYVSSLNVQGDVENDVTIRGRARKFIGLTGVIGGQVALDINSPFAVIDTSTLTSDLHIAGTIDRLHVLSEVLGDVTLNVNTNHHMGTPQYAAKAGDDSIITKRRR